MALQHDLRGARAGGNLVARLFKALSNRIFSRHMRLFAANDNIRSPAAEPHMYVNRKRPILRQRFIFVDGKFSHCVWEREETE